MSGSGPVSPGTTKTSDLTICASSTPRAVAASTAVWVDSSKVTTSSVTPFRAAASRTRWIEGWTGVSGTGRSLASDRPGRTERVTGTCRPLAPRSMAPMVALILADGDAPTRARLDTAWPDWADGIDLVIAADGGARHADDLGVVIDLWVGDGDSLGEAGLTALAATGVPIELSRPDKDETDTELAVRAALARGADRLVIVGALGGPRVDHALANVGLLALAELAGRPAVILEARSRISLVRAHRRARGRRPGRSRRGAGRHRVAAAAGRRRRGRHHRWPGLPVVRRAARRSVPHAASRTSSAAVARPSPSGAGSCS